MDVMGTWKFVLFDERKGKSLKISPYLIMKFGLREDK